MTNLLNSTSVTTIFLGDQLEIKRYTTSATQVMALIPTDVGRPIHDLTINLDYPELVADAEGSCSGRTAWRWWGSLHRV